MEKENRDICLSDAYIEENVLYAAGFEENIFLKYDMTNQKVKYLRVFDGFKLSESFCNGAIFKYGKSLFCFSKNSYEVAEFNIEEKNCKYYCPVNNIEERDIIRSHIRMEDNIWMLRAIDAPQVMVFSIKERNYIEYKTNIERKIDSYFPLAFEKSVCIGTKILRCIPGSSNLFILNTKSLKAHVIETGLTLSFLTIYRDGNDIYILSMSGQEMIMINVNTYKLVIYKTGYEGIKNCPFVGIIKVKKFFLFLPCYEQQIFCYELKNSELSEVKKIKLPTNFKRMHGTEQRALFLNWKKLNNIVYLLPFSGNGLIRIDLDTFEILSCPVKISEQDYYEWLLQINTIQDEKEIELKDYLSTLTGEKNTIIEDSNEIKRLGYFIWNKIKINSLHEAQSV